MIERITFIKSDDLYSDRFLTSTELFREETNFNINLPETREFKNGKCIVTDKDDTAWSITEIINLLNYLNRNTIDMKEYWDLKEENEQLKEQIKELNLKMTSDLNRWLRE